jgi:uncharacterized protein (TIGR03435 family)
LMMQALLTERLGLKMHFETAERPTYFLVPGSPGKTPPAGLQVSIDHASPADPEALGTPGVGANHLEAHEVPMARFAEPLTRVVGRKVIDRTGWTEKFNISLQRLPDEHQALPSSDAVALPPDTPSVFTALREQLGLSLEPAKAEVALLVIDHAERPSGN